MALTIESQPTGVLFPSQNYCGNFYFELSSDAFIQDYGASATLVIDVNGLPADGEYIELEGVRLTFRTIGSLLAPGEMEIPANAAATATAIADYFDSGLYYISAVATAGPDQVTFTKDAFWIVPGNSIYIDGFLETIANVSSSSSTSGYPLTVVKNFSIKYDVIINGEMPPIYSGEVTPKLVRDIGATSTDTTIKIDLSKIPINYEDLNNEFGLVSNQPLIFTTMQVRFAEKIGNMGSTYLYSNTINLLHASCNCNKYDYSEYVPGTSDKKFLYIEGDIDARTLCKGDKLAVTALYDAGNYQTEIDGAASGVVIIGLTERVSVFVDYSTMIQSESGNFLIAVAGTDNSNEVGPLEFVRRGSGNSECCNLSQLLFLNCLGAWQYMGITTLKSGSIQVRTTDYISCSTCGGGTKQRTGSKSTFIQETYFTRPLKVTSKNMELLQQFFNAGGYIDLDGNPVKLIAEEYAIEVPEGRIQIPFTVRRLEDDYALIDSVYNKL